MKVSLQIDKVHRATSYHNCVWGSGDNKQVLHLRVGPLQSFTLQSMPLAGDSRAQLGRVVEEEQLGTPDPDMEGEGRSMVGSMR